MIGFTICYIKHQKKYLLKQETVQFLGSSEDSEEWSKKIQETLDQGKIVIIILVSKIRVNNHILMKTNDKILFQIIDFNMIQDALDQSK